MLPKHLSLSASSADPAIAAESMHRQRTRNLGILQLLTASKSLLLLELVILGFFVAGPLIIFMVLEDEAYLGLALLATLSVISIHMGSELKFLDRQLVRGRKFHISSTKYISAFFAIFCLFGLLTLTTAPAIPFLSAVAGADVTTLSFQRGQFLKGREGLWSALAYISAMLTSVFVPYCLVLAYATKHRLRHAFLIISLIYCISFLVKALFLHLMLPLIAFLVEQGKVKLRHLVVLLTGITGALVFLISLSGFGSLNSSGFTSLKEYLSASYVPSSSLDFFIYRTFAIPVFSVVDTFTVHEAQLGGTYLLGKTSSFIATLAGGEKVNLERMVAAYQYGGWNEFANSNVIFIADSFVNFGVLGVIFYGLVIGLTFRIFRRSRDPAVRSLSVLYAFMLYSSPLLGMLLGNGYILLFGQALLVQMKSNSGGLGPIHHSRSMQPFAARMQPSGRFQVP